LKQRNFTLNKQQINKMSTGAYVPTVDQIAKDTLTQISYKYWSQLDENTPLEPYDSNLIVDIYKNELLGSK
jgi:hypothetical protein